MSYDSKASQQGLSAHLTDTTVQQHEFAGNSNDYTVDKSGNSDDSEEEEEERSPMYMVIYNMLAGCGIVDLPSTYMDSGWAVGLFLMFIIAVFSVYTLRLLIICGKKVKVLNYEDVCEKAFGKLWGYQLLSFSILIFDIGACLTYSIILGNSAHAVMSHLFGWHASYYRRIVIAVAYAVFLTPFCMGKDFQFIEKISAAAIFSIAGMISIVAIEYVFNYSDKIDAGHMHGRGKIEPIGDNLGKMLAAFGAISFAFSQQDQTFMIYKTLLNPTVHRFTVLSSWAMGIQFVLSSCVGVFGYVTFGQGTNDDILTNYPSSNHLILGTRVVYTFTMVFIFPTAFYPVRHFLYSMVYFRSNETFEKATFFNHLLFTLGPLAFFLGLALVITDLGFVMSLTGLLAAVLLTFIMPCACGLKLLDEPLWFWNAEEGRKWESFKTTGPMWALLVFGVFVAIVGTIQLFL